MIWDLIVSVPGHSLSFYFLCQLSDVVNILFVCVQPLNNDSHRVVLFLIDEKISTIKLMLLLFKYLDVLLNI